MAPQKPWHCLNSGPLYMCTYHTDKPAWETWVAPCLHSLGGPSPSGLGKVWYTAGGHAPEIFKVLGTCLASRLVTPLCVQCVQTGLASPHVFRGGCDTSWLWNGGQENQGDLWSGHCCFAMNFLYLPEHKLLRTRLTSGDCLAGAWLLLRGVLKSRATVVTLCSHGSRDPGHVCPSQHSSTPPARSLTGDASASGNERL